MPHDGLAPRLLRGLLREPPQRQLHEQRPAELRTAGYDLAVRVWHSFREINAVPVLRAEEELLLTAEGDAGDRQVMAMVAGWALHTLMKRAMPVKSPEHDLLPLLVALCATQEEAAWKATTMFCLLYGCPATQDAQK